jgi:SIR2-like domain
VDEIDWTRLIAQLKNGRCTPFLGAGACATLPKGSELSQRWADEYDYPFPDETDLARVMQFVSIAVGDPVTVKEMVCDEILAAAEPDFDDPVEPHALLADFPLPVFVTTNYDELLTRALERVGRRPQVESCPWNVDRVTNDDSSLSTCRPTKDQPLIYHLHGLASVPKSIVLTENDYLEFLVGLVRSRSEDPPRMIPNVLRSALSDYPLLFIGYSMQDWTFRVLFYGLLTDTIKVNQRLSVSVQLKPAVDELKQRAQERACEFLIKNFRNWQIQIFWGSASDFCTELRNRLDGSAT